jgi:hypothetical protein
MFGSRARCQKHRPTEIEQYMRVSAAAVHLALQGGFGGRRPQQTLRGAQQVQRQVAGRALLQQPPQQRGACGAQTGTSIESACSTICLGRSGTCIRPVM